MNRYGTLRNPLFLVLRIPTFLSRPCGITLYVFCEFRIKGI